MNSENDEYWTKELGEHKPEQRAPYTRIREAGVKVASAGYRVKTIRGGIAAQWVNGWIQVTVYNDNAEDQIARLRALAEVPVVRG